ncbi:MAG: glutathione synthase [Deltaproteobacteria bacterium]|nr:glutathione synthase [Deltaproteobacteria bacterium]
MILSFHPCFDTDVQVILGDRRLDSADLQLIRNAKAIILPQTCPQEIYNACSVSGASVFPSYEMRFKYPGKTGQSLQFKDFGFLHPDTLRWRTVDEFKKAYPASNAFPHDLPFFIKDDKSHEADGVFLVKDMPSLEKALDYLALRESSGLPGFVTQEFIPSEGNVLRAVIIGRQGITYWKRPRKPGQEITTISRGAIIDHDWQPDLQEKGKVQALLLSDKTGINLAAVDFVFPLSEDNPEPLFLEINYFFGRRGLGGSEAYYGLLYQAVQDWLGKIGMDPESVTLV